MLAIMKRLMQGAEPARQRAQRLCDPLDQDVLLSDRHRQAAAPPTVVWLGKGKQIRYDGTSPKCQRRAVERLVSRSFSWR